MLAWRGLRDPGAGVIAAFHRFANHGHKLRLLDLGHKTVEAKPGVGLETPGHPGRLTVGIHLAHPGL